MLYLNTKQVFISRLHSDTVDRNDIFQYFGFLFFLNLTLYLICWILLLNHIILYLQFVYSTKGPQDQFCQENIQSLARDALQVNLVQRTRG